MSEMNLQEVIVRHARWISGDDDGVRAYLHGADLSGAALSRANLSEANLSRANLSGADLSRADLSSANLASITLCGATIDGARITPHHIGGPGHILCVLTEDEWAMITRHRTHPGGDDE